MLDLQQLDGSLFSLPCEDDVVGATEVWNGLVDR